MKWFVNPQTLEELKKQYKRLAMQHHPDLGGNENDMKEINAEYDTLFELLKNVHQTTEGKTYTNREESTESPEEFREIIEHLLNLAGINIEICGSWLWITGNTLPHKEILKKMQFRWSKSKCAWYFHREGYRKYNSKSYTLDEIRDFYGSETVKSKKSIQLTVV